MDEDEIEERDDIDEGAASDSGEDDGVLMDSSSVDMAELSEEDAAEAEAAFASGYANSDDDASLDADPDEAGDDETEASAAGDTTGDDVDSADDTSESDGGGSPAGEEADQPTYGQLLETIEALNARVRKTEGHIGQLRRSEQESAEAAARKATGGGEQPTKAQVKAAFGSSESFKKIAEEFPDFAAALKDEITALQLGAAEPAPAGMTRAEIEAAAIEAAKVQIVEEEHEGWRDVVKSDPFIAWAGTLKGDSALRLDSDKPRDVISLMDDYKEFLGFVESMGDAGKELTMAALLDRHAKAGVESQAEATEKARKTRNQRRLQRSVPATKGNASGRAEAKQEDPEALFSAAYRKERGIG